MNVLTIIQGDSVDAELELVGHEAPEVSKLSLESNCFDKRYELSPTYEPLIWILSIPSEDTSQFRVGVFKYNLVAEFNGGRTATIVYNQPMEVLYKDNVWTEAN